MYGIVVVSHGQLARELLNSAKMIVGEITNQKISTVSLIEGMSPEEFVNSVYSAVMNSMDKDGVIILTDLFGGSTTNFLASEIYKRISPENKNIIIISGVNLAMLLSAITNNEDNVDLNAVADRIINDAKDNIRNVSLLIMKKDGIS